MVSIINSVKSRVRFHLPIFFFRFQAARCRSYFICSGVRVVFFVPWLMTVLCSVSTFLLFVSSWVFCLDSCLLGWVSRGWSPLLVALSLLEFVHLLDGCLN